MSPVKEKSRMPLFISLICGGFCGVTIAQNSSMTKVDFVPSDILHTVEGSVQHVSVNYSSLPYDMVMTVGTSSNSVANVLDTDVHLESGSVINSTGTISVNSSFRIQAVRVGKAVLNFHFTKTDGSEIAKNETPVTSDLDVWVVRQVRIVDQIFPIVIVIVLFANTCTMGCKLEWAVIKSLIVRPASVSIGSCCQFLGMPLFAFIISVAFSLPVESAFGLLLIGCCPGGGLSNIFSVLLDGDLTLSITMTFFSTILALGMMPLNLFIYSHYWTDGGRRFPVPYISIIVSLALLCIPVGIGMAIRNFRPLWAKKGIALIRPFGITLIILALTTGVYSNLFLVYQWNATVVGSSFLLPIVGFIIGALFGTIFKRGVPKTKTICLETGIQNSALATGLIQIMYDQPDRDLLSVMPLTCAMAQFLMVTVTYVVYFIYGKCKKKKSLRSSKSDTNIILDPDDLVIEDTSSTRTMVSVASGDVTPESEVTPSKSSNVII